MLEKMLNIGVLFDFYGALLTEKQQRCISMHYLDDLSLAEIADEFQVSRQAVHDILQRAEQTLAGYERKLRLAERYRQEQSVLQKIMKSLGSLPDEMRRHPELMAAEEAVQSLLAEERMSHHGF